MIAPIYYISQGKTTEEHLNNIRAACVAGCKLIQLRLKDIDELSYTNAAKEAKHICSSYSATLLINDNITVAKLADADGVHLGQSDMRPEDARRILGDKIIGGTANTIDDCLSLIKQKVDYIGLGPFRYTTTKAGLSPILALDGYREIIKKLSHLNIDIPPIVAIGGIQETDFKDLFNSGVSSVAVSGLLTKKPAAILKEIIDQANREAGLILN